MLDESRVNKYETMDSSEDLVFMLTRLLRRVKFRSESRVMTELFFELLYAVLREMNSWSEDKLEEELASGVVKFKSFYFPHSVQMDLHIRRVDQ